MKKLFIYSLLFTCIPLSIITASQINDVITKYENGNPKIIHVFQQVSNNSFYQILIASNDTDIYEMLSKEQGIYPLKKGDI